MYINKGNWFRSYFSKAVFSQTINSQRKSVHFDKMENGILWIYNPSSLERSVKLQCNTYPLQYKRWKLILIILQMIVLIQALYFNSVIPFMCGSNWDKVYDIVKHIRCSVAWKVYTNVALIYQILEIGTLPRIILSFEF